MDDQGGRQPGGVAVGDGPGVDPRRFHPAAALGLARADLADAALRVLPDSGIHRHTVDVAY